MVNTKTVLIVGHGDVIDQSLQSHFEKEGCRCFLSGRDVDVFDSADVQRIFEKEDPEYVFVSSLRSGGIEANRKYPAEFFYQNLVSDIHVLEAAYRHKVSRLIYFGSSCVYPAKASQPIKEKALLTGPLEPTSEAYAVAKISGLKLAEYYRRQYGVNWVSVIPATVYGPGLDTDIEQAHVLGALLGKFHRAAAEGQKTVEVWGDGSPRREFVYSEDFVSAILLLLDKDIKDIPVNAGTGEDITIKSLARMIAGVVGFEGKISFDRSKPGGVKRKLLDSRRLKSFGWRPRVDLQEGIKRTYQWYKDHRL